MEPDLSTSVLRAGSQLWCHQAEVTWPWYFPRDPHPPQHQQPPCQPQTRAGQRHILPRALTCWMLRLPVMAWYERTVSEGTVFTTRDSRTTSRT